MSRPMLLVFLLLVLIITSQFEWRQQLVNDMDMDAAPNHNHLLLSKTKRDNLLRRRLFCWNLLSDALKLFLESQLIRMPLSEGQSTGRLVILSQEKSIYRLNELVRSLERQLVQCRCNNETGKRRPIVVPLTEGAMGLEQHVLED